jgi:hypothetical protein
MVVGEFTASNIAMEEDAREEDKQKSVIDIEKLKADIAANKVLSQQVIVISGWAIVLALHRTRNPSISLAL